MPVQSKKTLPPLHPNAGIGQDYERRLLALVEQMHRSLYRWVLAAYRAGDPHLARDTAAPADSIRLAVSRLVRRWQRRFDKMGPGIAWHFATGTSKHSDSVLASALRDAGATIRMSETPATREAVKAAITENVALIRSVAQQHLQHVEVLVAQSVAAGRDVGELAQALEERYDLTRRRAAFIARDQNNKATAVIARARQLDLGLEQAIWMHSGGGKEPRPSHLAFSGKIYSVRDGVILDGETCWPGTQPNCRCVCRPVIPGFEP